MRTKEVDKIVRRLWVLLAEKAADHAVAFADDIDCQADAEKQMELVGHWLDNAGARAAKWYFRVPS